MSIYSLDLVGFAESLVGDIFPLDNSDWSWYGRGRGLRFDPTTPIPETTMSLSETRSLGLLWKCQLQWDITQHGQR